MTCVIPLDVCYVHLTKGGYALQGLTPEQILAQYQAIPDQDHGLSAQHILAGQHMHMQQGDVDGQQQ